MNIVGSYTVPVEPDSDRYRIEDVPVAGTERALDGTLHSTYVAIKRRWQVSWPGLTAAQRDLLLAQLRVAAHINWQPPEGGSFTVRVASSSWQVTPGAAAHYTVSAELEEQ